MLHINIEKIALSEPFETVLWFFGVFTGAKRHNLAYADQNLTEIVFSESVF